MPNPLTRIVEAKYITLEPLFDERSRRLWAAVEARSLGRGGIIRVAEATGLARSTIRAGLKELDLPTPGDDGPVASRRLRPPGGGRKPLTDRDPDLLRELESLVDPVTRGDPMSPLRWTCKSAEKLAEGSRPEGTSSVSGPSIDSSTTWVTASSPIARRSRAKVTRIGMPNSSTSTAGPRRSNGRASPWSRSIPRRKSGS